MKHYAASSFRVRTLTLICLSTLAMFCGCGGGDDDTGSSWVVDVSAVDNTLRVGDGTVINVDFNFDAQRIFDDERNVVVVVHLPPEFRYRNNTSEIDGDVSDHSLGAQVTNCENGESYLVYDMDRFDLDAASAPGGEANARLTLTVDALAPIGVTTIEAAADNHQPVFSCGSPFFADELVALSVQ